MGHMAEAIMTKSFINPRARRFFKEKEEVFILFCEVKERPLCGYPQLEWSIDHSSILRPSTRKCLHFEKKSLKASQA